MDNNKTLFQNNGIKNTKQRNYILDVLRGALNPLTAEQIYFQIHKIDENISLSTVYRTLDLLVEKEILVKTKIADDNKALYFIKGNQHTHHLICISCKGITTIDYCPIHQFEHTVSKENSFEITGHNLEIFGYCSKCKRTEGRDEK